MTSAPEPWQPGDVVQIVEGELAGSFLVVEQARLYGGFGKLYVLGPVGLRETLASSQAVTFTQGVRIGRAAFLPERGEGG